MSPRPDPQESQGPEHEASRESQQRLQLHLDRKAKMSTILSNIMKRLSETQRNMIDKLK
ncbi:hypothetical protein [Streptomyces sp. Tu102]|uniref:hypothetical protein n=1 Tax=Streptomyces sp. Tu102 TaxID=2838019 RepID=UPI001BDC73F9|nr:hypothetical protein [Streptomyces sp. Tu102]MBT1091784.1 hypothetical protein [Streptomyces sp. Tu102]